MITNKVHIPILNRIVCLVFALAVTNTCISSPSTTSTGDKELKKTIGLFQWHQSNMTTSFQTNETDDIIFTTYNEISQQHYHSFTYGGGRHQPAPKRTNMMTLAGKLTNEGIQELTSLTIHTTKQNEPSTLYLTEKTAPPQQEFFLDGQVYNHGNLGEIKATLYQSNKPTHIFSQPTTKPQIDMSLMLGQDVTLNTNNKLLLTAEVVTKNIDRTSFQNSNTLESNNVAVFTALISNNTLLRKQIVFSIIQPEHEAATLSASLIYFLYGPRFFSIHDIHHINALAENIDPLIPNW